MRNRALIAGLIVATMLGGCKEGIFDPARPTAS
jgi:hypothetical protein